MAEQECPHGEHPAVCLDCLEGTPATRPRWTAIGKSHIARYPSQCPGCGASIRVGEHRVQRYDRSDGERTVYVHSDMGCKPKN